MNTCSPALARRICSQGFTLCRPNTITYKLLLSMHRVVYSLIIINKAGGLVYNRDFNNALNKSSVNDLLVLAGTFHGYAPF